jgi:hypothetical protein
LIVIPFSPIMPLLGTSFQVGAFLFMRTTWKPSRYSRRRVLATQADAFTDARLEHLSLRRLIFYPIFIQAEGEHVSNDACALRRYP